MKTLKFQSQDNDINVDYLVDLIGNSEPIMIYDITQWVAGVAIKGLNGEAITFGMYDKQVEKSVSNKGKTHTPYTLTEFVKFAVDNNLTLKIFEDGKNVITKNTLTALAWETTTLDAGVCGVAQLDVLTFPTTAGATQGDYVLLSNGSTGETAALWLDIDAAGTAPTGALYVAADYKIKVEIVTDGTAAANGTLAYTALAASDFATGLDLTDNEDGTIDIEQEALVAVDAPVLKNANDSGAGSITKAQTTEGLDGEDYEMELEVVGGNKPYIFTTASTLPEGLTLSTEGVIAGLPQEAGTFVLTIKVTDYFGIEANLTNKNLVITEAV
jgi:hypothetical protein